jgi:hypothetical protein
VTASGLGCVRGHLLRQSVASRDDVGTDIRELRARRCEVEPLVRLDIVLRHAQPVLEGSGQRHLGVDVALIGRAAIPDQSFTQIALVRIDVVSPIG